MAVESETRKMMECNSIKSGKFTKIRKKFNTFPSFLKQVECRRPRDKKNIKNGRCQAIFELQGFFGELKANEYFCMCKGENVDFASFL